MQDGEELVSARSMVNRLLYVPADGMIRTISVLFQEKIQFMITIMFQVATHDTENLQISVSNIAKKAIQEGRESLDSGLPVLACAVLL